MRSKEIVTVDSLNSHITAGWRLVRAFENNGYTKYLIVKDDTEERADDKGSKNNCRI